MSTQLEERFFNFAKNVRDFCRKCKWDIINVEYIRQLIRSSGSVGANYIEASDDLGKADEKMKIKIARREAKESVHWIRLILTYNDVNLESQQNILVAEAIQIKKNPFRNSVEIIAVLLSLYFLFLVSSKIFIRSASLPPGHLFLSKKLLPFEK